MEMGSKKAQEDLLRAIEQKISLSLKLTELQDKEKRQSELSKDGRSKSDWKKKYLDMEQKHNEIRDLYNKLILDTQHL